MVRKRLVVHDARSAALIRDVSFDDLLIKSITADCYIKKAN